MELLKKLGVNMKMVQRIKEMDPVVRNEKVAKMGTDVNMPNLSSPKIRSFLFFNFV